MVQNPSLPESPTQWTFFFFSSRRRHTISTSSKKENTSNSTKNSVHIQPSSMDRMEPILQYGHQMQNLSLLLEISTSGGLANTRSVSERTILGSGKGSSRVRRGDLSTSIMSNREPILVIRWRRALISLCTGKFS